MSKENQIMSRKAAELHVKMGEFMCWVLESIVKFSFAKAGKF